MIQVGIVGGTGYTGVELLRLLAQHPQCQLQVITSRGSAGVRVSELYPNLRGRVDLSFTEPDVARLSQCDVVFFATPNGTAMQMAPALLAQGVRVIDLAADFRLRDPQVWQDWYGVPHACPELLPEAIYGLPELYRDLIRKARLIANPGCYPTAVTLGWLPLLEAQLITPDELIADAKSGVSGAGRKAELNLLHAEVSENFRAYAVPRHRHWPEIKQTLEQVSGQALDLTFVPHLLPQIRGIHATLYARLRDAEVDLQALYARRYLSEPFVDVLPAGQHPETRSVRASNLCRIAVHRPLHGTRVVVLSVIDNLVKGAAGQAIHNLNLMFGLEETLALTALPVMP